MEKFIPLSEVLILDAIKRDIAHYGIEGWIQTVEQVYIEVPQVKEKIFEVFEKYFFKIN